MKWATEAPLVSERTRQAVQDYTALNTIAAAAERVWMERNAARQGVAMPAGEFAHVIVATWLACPDAPRVRLPLDCPLARRLMALGLIRQSPSGTRGVVQQRLPR